MGLRAAFTLACLLAGLLSAELVLRYLILSPSELARTRGAGLRDARHYANPFLEEQYWRLEWIFDHPDGEGERPPYDPLLGWVSHRIEPGTYRLAAEPEARGRRPILLYGASYAACVTPPEECFQGLLEESDLGADHYLLNYSVGGYGIDQVWLLMRETLGRFADRDPIVVVGLVADSDFERCVVGFRSWPKPRLRLEDGELVGEGTVAESSAAYLAERGTGVRSFAWRALLYSSGLVPGPIRSALTGAGAKRREQVELIEALLLAIRDELRSRQLEGFVLLIPSPHILRPNPAERPAGALQDPEGTIAALLEEHRIPYVNARARMAARMRALGDLTLIYRASDPGKNHPTALGNQVLFEALRDGLSGRFTGGR